MLISLQLLSRHVPPNFERTGQRLRINFFSSRENRGCQAILMHDHAKHNFVLSVPVSLTQAMLRQSEVGVSSHAQPTLATTHASVMWLRAVRRLLGHRRHSPPC